MASQVRSGRDGKSYPGSLPSYLGLGHDGVVARGSAEEGGQRGGDDDGIWPDKAAEVTAGDGVLLGLHHQGVHGVEAVPWQPHSALLAHERGSLEVQGQGGAPIGDQVKPGEEGSGLPETVNAPLGEAGTLRAEGGAEHWGVGWVEKEPGLWGPWAGWNPHFPT